jgi:hypothetical protein
MAAVPLFPEPSFCFLESAEILILRHGPLIYSHRRITLVTDKSSNNSVKTEIGTIRLGRKMSLINDVK